ncbi:MAG: hypothetical protein ACI8R9_001073 [Paraglaciecola sp.]|jgi:hypothetical protein
MELTIILMMLLIVVAIGAVKLNEPSLGFPFKKKGTLFTAVECSFLELIEEAVGGQYRVMCRVKLSDILAVREKTDKKAFKNALSRANGRQLDFVLCARGDMTPMVAIDLVHSNGKEGYKSQRDWFVSGALDAAHIPHLRIKVRSGYNARDIRECIEHKVAPMRPKATKTPLIQGTGCLIKDPTIATRPTKPLGHRPIAA